MSRISLSAAVDPTDRFTLQIKSMQDQIAELQRAFSKPSRSLAFGPGTVRGTSGIGTTEDWSTQLVVPIIGYPGNLFIFSNLWARHSATGDTIQHRIRIGGVAGTAISELPYVSRAAGQDYPMTMVARAGISGLASVTVMHTMQVTAGAGGATTPFTTSSTCNLNAIFVPN